MNQSNIKKTLIILAVLPALVLIPSCEEGIPEAAEETTVLSVGIRADGAKTVLGPSVDGKRKVYWADGDCISLNGTASAPLSGVPAEASSATFTFSGALEAPYNLLYPAAFYKDASTITLPATQAWTEGGMLVTEAFAKFGVL